MKSLVNTSFGRKEREITEMARRTNRPMFNLVGNEIDIYEDAQTLYQQTGLYVFGDNEFAFRYFNDTNEYKMSLSALERAPLFVPSNKILDKLPESIEKALVVVEERCTPSKVKLDATYKSPEFRSDAWQLYSRVGELVPEILPKMIDRRTIKRRADENLREFESHCIPCISNEWYIPINEISY
ncbi:MAG: hypothetical protein AABY07_01685 [Nanoarchaeota archaeon]